ncbi:hypothetical protein BDQ17DRAFT_1332330 [Cyathus striatus]|nr:hypothetical protein BDQ17DRAFT_1332330 [Cyathus striatus]
MSTVGSEAWHEELDRKWPTAALTEIALITLSKVEKDVLCDTDDVAFAIVHLVCWVIIAAAEAGFKGWKRSLYPRDDMVPHILGYVYENDEITDTALRCWRKKSFKEIREYEPFLSPNAIYVKQEAYKLMKTVVDKGWERPYCGDRHLLLLREIKDMCRENTKSPNSSCRNFVPFIQSSGTGKSRMIDEMASLVFTLPFNLRNPEEFKPLAYPPPDDAISKYMLEEECYETARSRVFVFLKHLFVETLNELRTHKVDGPLKTTEELASWWKIHLLETEPETGKTRRTILYDRIIKMSNVEFEKFGTSNTLSENTSSALHNLLERIPVSDHLQLVLYFDEADTLSSHTTINRRGYEMNMYDVMLSCLRELASRPSMFVVFLSTESRPSKLLLPKIYMETWSDMHAEGKRSMLPLAGVAFDCSPDFPLPLRSGKLKLEMITDMRFMAQFGRTLWQSFFTGHDEKHKTKRIVLAHAQEKLLNQRDFTFSLASVSNLGALASLDVLLSLSYDPTFGQEGELVTNHMRLAYNFSMDRLYGMDSGYSSEPILAEAASQVISDCEKVHPNAMVEILSHHVNKGVINVGYCGELTSRLLLTMAYRKATQISAVNLYSGGCGIVPFLEALYTDEHINLILNHVPDNRRSGSNSRRLREVFASSWIRFTHFDRTDYDDDVSSFDILTAFVCGVAIICTTRQVTTINIIIPVLLDKDKPLSESNMSAILIRTSSHDTVRRVAWYHIDEEEIGLFRDNTLERPYIRMVMDLGVRRPDPVTHTKANHQTENERAAKRIKIYDDHSDATPGETEHRIEHPRYSIFAYGCKANVYRVIQPNDEPKFNSILKMKSFYSRIAPYDLMAPFQSLREKVETNLDVQLSGVQVGMNEDDSDYDSE